MNLTQRSSTSPATHRGVAALVVLALALALALAVITPARGAAPTSGTPCDVLAVGTYSVTSRPLLCVHMVRDASTGVPVSIQASSSHDAGRHWRTFTATGIPLAFTTMVTELLGSRSIDGGWFLQTLDSGVYRSKDDGATWTLADPLAKPPSTFRSLEATSVVLPVVGAQDALLYANADRQGSALLIPPARLPVATNPDYTVRLIDAGHGPGPYADTTIALATRPATATVPDTHAVVSTCATVLSCTDLHFEAPAGQIPEDLSLAPAFAKTGRVYLWTRNYHTNRYFLYQSSDGAKTFTPNTAFQSILKQQLNTGGSYPVAISVAQHPTTKGLVYARIHFERLQSGNYPEQLWRSRDDGKSWHQIGRARLGPNFTAVGGLPWTSSPSVFQENAANLMIDPSGDLVVVGQNPQRRTSTFWCSHDGVTWRDSC